MKLTIPVVVIPVIVALIPSGATISLASDAKPSAVSIARATDIPSCTLFVDAAAGEGGDGSLATPHGSITAAVAVAQAGAVICVAQGTYSEQIEPGDKAFTLAGGFQGGTGFKVRDSAAFISKAQGSGTGSFLKIAGDNGPNADALTAIDGFEITGYSQAIFRDYWEPQRFDITNNHIHDNVCENQDLTGGAFSLVNTSGTIKGNVIRNNACGRGGGGTLVDNLSTNTIVVANNLVDANSGTEPDSSHGGAFYFFVNKLTVEGNLFTNNTVTQWGAGLFVGAYTAGGQFTNATMRWNVYRDNKAGNSGGGFFCDEGANCSSEHELYVSNCGGNILVDSGAGGSGPTKASFNHITSVGGLTPDCSAPGMGFWVNSYETSAPDTYTINNAIFWGNADGQDVVASCDKNCAIIKVTVDHSMLKMAPGQGVKITYGSNNVMPADPLFVAPDKGDYRLQPGSPALRKGKPAGTDLGAYPGNARSPHLSEAAPTPNGAGGKPPPAEVTPSQASPPSPPSVPSARLETAPSSQAPLLADAAQVKAAYEEAKALGTIAAWRAFLAHYPEGFYADMAGAYLRSLGYMPGSGAPSPGPAAPPSESPTPASDAQSAGKSPKSLIEAGPEPSNSATRLLPATTRGAQFFGFPEQFNRYYTDPSWKPLKTIYVSPTGEGDGTGRDKPAAPADAVSAAQPGTLIHFLPGAYQGGLEFTKEMSGTYDAPIVLYGERKIDGTLGVTLDCDFGRRKTCLNFEGADFVAVDGFLMVNGVYGIRAVGMGFPASEHSRGIAMLNCEGRDQHRDPFKTAQADWSVIEGNLGYGAQKGDGHGIYISGGSDWGIVRNNETHSNESSDLQINADPASACKEVNVPYDDPRCDAYAGEGEGGQGASDYFLIEGNYCHRSNVGPNFTSVRRSLIRNNIFGPQSRHNVSFWQETGNPKLGSSENRILNNLFITHRRHALKFENHSGRNILAGNIVIGVSIDGTEVTGDPSALLVDTDPTSANNAATGNIYGPGRFEGSKPGPADTVLSEFKAEWFTAFATNVDDAAAGFAPAKDAPFLDILKQSPDVPVDRNGTARGQPSDAGPYEIP